MKKLFLFSCFVFLYSFTNAQSTPIEQKIYSKTPDSILIKRKNGQSKPAEIDTIKGALDSITFLKVLNEQFTTLVTGQAKNSIGNFASLDLKEPTVSFAGSSVIKNKSVFTVNACGGVSDGFFSIFNNSTLNTKVSLDFKLHLLNHERNSLSFISKSQQDFEDKRTSIINKFMIDSIAIEFRREKIELVKKRNLAVDKAKVLSVIIDTIKNTDTKDSLKYELAILQFNIQSDSVKIENYSYNKQLALRTNKTALGMHKK